MIFVTTGTQAPFNRLVKAIDRIAGQTGYKFVVQATGIDFSVKYVEIVEFLAPKEFNAIFQEAELVISHAGMGSIISALTIAKPIVVVPRLATLGEHRNEHQMATAKKMESLGYVPVVYDLERDLLPTIHDMIEVASNSDVKKKTIGDFASASLVSSIKDFILR